MAWWSKTQVAVALLIVLVTTRLGQTASNGDMAAPTPDALGGSAAGRGTPSW
jgi:hypothetical protein